LDDAIELIKNRKAKFEPKVLGIDSETKKEILIKTGRFGPYVTDGNKNVSLKGYKIDEVTLEESIKLLSEKK
jgi:DNA topoisomerase-1